MGEDGQVGWNTFADVSHPGPYLVQDKLEVAADKAGNLYLVGTVQVSSKTMPRTLQKNAFVARLNRCGRLVWNMTLGSSSTDYGNSLTLDGDGNLYFAGLSTAVWGSPLQASMESGGGFLANIPPSPLGDLNLDGAVNSLDFLLMAARLAEVSFMLPCGDAWADIDGDGRLDSLDLLREALTVLGD